MHRVTLGVITTGVCVALSSACGGGQTPATASAPPAVPAASSSASSAAGRAADATPSPTAKVTAPASPQAFSARISRIPSRATVRYSWHSGCPVSVSDLRLITMTYWGMDHRPHDGTMVVNADSASKIVKVFHALYDERYPIRRMELVDNYKGSDFDSIEADNTSAFNCRNATGASSWSQHAYGHAVDVNPCENPYVHPNGHIEHPACVKYGDRKRRDPGLIHPGDKVVRAFASIGWGWGGTWGGPWDFQHFSATGH